MNWIDRHHIVRRLLLTIYSYFLLKITYKIFCNGITNLDVFKVSIYVTFSGIITFMLKFYFDSRDIEIKGRVESNKKKEESEKE